MNSNVNIKLLGREYNLRSHESAIEIEKAVKFVEERLAETGLGKSVDTRDLTVLTLLNLAGDYLRLVAQQKNGSEQQNVRLRQVVDQLENGLLG